jgi:hypothetical protein
MKMNEKNRTELLRIPVSIHKVGLMNSTGEPGVVLMTDQGGRVEVPISRQEAVRLAIQLYDPVELVVQKPRAGADSEESDND